VECELGRGAMGTVYRGVHIDGREVAIKALHPHLVEQPEMLARFEREAALAAKLAHPNVAGVIAVAATPHGRVMVLDLARGTGLDKIIADGPLAPARAVTLVAQLLRGLDHAHAAGLVHRDLKPDNVMVETADDGTETARILDFGIAVLSEREAALASTRLTASGIVLGTPAYMAPEQARGTVLDGRADLFALGVMMYEMLAGKLPFDASGLEAAVANISKDPPAFAVRAPGVSVDPLLEAFVRKLMARRRDARFSSARDALEVLELISRDRNAAALVLGAAKPVPVRRWWKTLVDRFVMSS
jgi:eukaryotic-like serine/threonine-protein kinase